MSASDFDQFLTLRRAAAAAYCDGDAEPLARLAPTTGDGSYHSPSGDSVAGAAAVVARYRQDAAGFQPGATTRFEILQQEVSGDLGFWTGFQIAAVRPAGQSDRVEMRIRITEVFRRIDGEWKLVHRHGDLGHQNA